MNVLSIQELSLDDITIILDRADDYLDKIRSKSKIDKIFEDKIILNAFFENSTRTLISFETAAIRLGARVINFSADTSSLKKGETIIDTLQTLNMMHPDALVIRAKEEEMPKLASKYVSCPILNAGNGTKEHPTQALLDMLTIKRKLGEIQNKTVAICGDIKHSRVAGSNLQILKKLGANVRLVGPDEFLPDNLDSEVEMFNDMNKGIEKVDIIMMLRVQKERLSKNPHINDSDYFENYGLTCDRLKKYASSAFVMHPGPMNRGVEISDEVADDQEISLILNQVEAGVAVRMACIRFCIS